MRESNRNRTKPNILLNYLQRHLGTIALFGLFAAIFATVFSLYALPAEAVAYAALLCVFAGLIFTVAGFFRYFRRHKTLNDMLSRITLSVDGLPAPRDLLEQDYQALLQVVHTDRMLRISQADSIKSDLTDYYTLWAHQIKTPIAAMQLLLQSGDPPQKTELSMELFKIEQYVEMVLYYLRLDSDSSDFVLKKYDLDEIIRQAARRYAKLFILKKIPLDFTQSGLTVLTDEKWLVFVLEQLLSNSLKYTKEGKISIYIEDRTLLIADTGIGIQPEDLPRVFEKGFTGYNGREDKKSTGIGLYLCQRILTKLGHGIGIESEVGKGTCVKIKLDSINFLAE
ncbi:MAG: HAMP domain-containing histidine kinase [Dehalobacter sp. 4CP]|uniref:sensor histidine kinase n=1 Tax=Dehalobacter sp. CP TaxID=2594474 RepID=UPI0013C5F884|nr:HAMP domain-containing histidine kinase [Dehalobacter sp. 4CP]